MVLASLNHCANLILICTFSAACFSCRQYSRPTAITYDFNNANYDIHPSEDRIVFTTADGGFYTFRESNNAFSEILKDKGYCSYPCYSQDGHQILYAKSSRIGENYSIYLYRNAQRKHQRLTNSERVTDILPVFGENNKIIFARSSKSREYAFGGDIWIEWRIVELDLESQQVKELSPTTFNRITSINYHNETGKLYLTAEMREEDSRSGFDLPPTVLYSLSKDGELSLESPIEEVRNNAYCTEIDVSSSGGRVFISDRIAQFYYQVEVTDIEGQSTLAVPPPGVSKYLRRPSFDPKSRSIYFLAATEWTDSNQPVFSLWRVPKIMKEPTMVLDESTLIYGPEL